LFGHQILGHQVQEESAELIEKKGPPNNSIWQGQTDGYYAQSGP
jgi:hypothetical protein